MVQNSLQLQKASPFDNPSELCL